MAYPPNPVPDAASRFFDHYLRCLDQASVPERQRRWYVRHVENFIKAQNGRKIKHLAASGLQGYFEALRLEPHMDSRIRGNDGNDGNDGKGNNQGLLERDLNPFITGVF